MLSKDVSAIEKLSYNGTRDMFNVKQNEMKQAGGQMFWKLTNSGVSDSVMD